MTTACCAWPSFRVSQIKPIAYQDIALLLKAVEADPTAVSYAWAKDVAHDSRIKILRVLWYD